MRKLLSIELNEVNFDFVRAYGKRGELPVLNRLIDQHGLTETLSEERLEEIEPWIQWVSVHTGKSFAEHKIFRLGDIVDHPDVRQIWEILEAKNISVGAVSPMNARNACINPAFFVPDPWTQTSVTGSAITNQLYKSIAQIVNDNAKAKVSFSSIAWLVAGIIRFAKPTHYHLYFSIFFQARKSVWMRAMLLDLLLTDMFIALNHNRTPDYASLFLNAAAHIQHHYMFSAAVYNGPHCNPQWYVASDSDPILDVYKLYDSLIDSVIKKFPAHRILIATGLHQIPYSQLLYYWRLRDHAKFLKRINVSFSRLEPRMSRDFVLYFDSIEQGCAAGSILSTAIASDGQPLFEIDNRGDSLFVMLVYPNEINVDLTFSVSDNNYGSLRNHCAFVAIKNGDHSGIGYLIDTDQVNDDDHRSIKIEQLFVKILDNFSAF
jgi:hypothetical protein